MIQKFMLMVKRNMYCRISLLQQGLLTERRPEWSSKRWDMKTVITARENPGQHTGMKQIGVLHTDPPKWLDNDHPPF
ncbi:hypothetical protein HTZ85_27085 [Escherichia coli]|nr:hypothetical protein [Escherichia coli]